MIQEKALEDVGSYLEHLGLFEKAFFIMQKNNPQVTGIRAKRHKRFGTDLVTFDMTVSRNKESGSYKADGYTATLTRVPEIAHGVYEGIDTHALEQRLSRYDWGMDFNSFARAGAGMLNTFNDLVLLSQLYNKKANETSGLLMLKYWAGTPLEQALKISPDPTHLRQQLFLPLNKDINDVGAIEAYNLLCGRSLLKYVRKDRGFVPSHWEVLRFGSLIRYPLFDLAAHLKKLPTTVPMNDHYGQELVTELIHGGLATVELKIKGSNVKAFIQADPENAALAVFDTQMRPIKLKYTTNTEEPTVKRHRGKGKSP